jgi:RNA polymerase sigma factor (sigma-70 family)
MSFAWHEIRGHLMQSSSTLGFQRSFDTLRRVHDPVARFPDRAALLETLHRGAGDPARKNRILRALIAAAQGDRPASDCALAVLLLALWPGLDAIRRRSIGRRIAPADEIASDLLARTTEAIRGLDPSRVTWIAATVLRNVERDMIRARQREADRQGAAADVDPDSIPADLDQPDGALHRARLVDDMRRLIGGDAALVIRVAVEGFSQAEVAGELGLTEAAARKRYQRATRKLRDRLPENV